MVRTMTDTGVEIRVYSNKQGISRCVNNAQGNVNAQRGSTIAYANFNTYQNCSSQIVGCDAIVYIRDGKVLQVKGVGLCYSDERSRPEPGYERFMKK